MGSQDQSPAYAVSYQCRYSPYVCHSSPCRSAAAAAIGPSTKPAKLSAQRMVKGGPNGPDPRIAAFVAATPKISTGTVSGSTNTASSKPPRRRATESAAPTRPMKVNAGVPAARVNASQPAACNSTLSINLLPHRRERRVCHDVSSPADHVSNGMTMQNTSSGAHTGFVDGGAQI